MASDGFRLNEGPHLACVVSLEHACDEDRPEEDPEDYCIMANAHYYRCISNLDFHIDVID